jgi:hypothetical protein
MKHPLKSPSPPAPLPQGERGESQSPAPAPRPTTGFAQPVGCGGAKHASRNPAFAPQGERGENPFTGSTRSVVKEVDKSPSPLAGEGLGRGVDCMHGLN